MKLQVNNISGEEVREETQNGRDYLVAPVQFIRSMDLHRGYVPNEEVKVSTNNWDGAPIVQTHPRDTQDEFISVNSPHSDQDPYGFITNPEDDTEDGDVVISGEAWIDVEEAESQGGEAEMVVNKLNAGENVQVSSAYGGDDLPAGRYDGEYYANVKGNIRPDHVAMFVNGLARCTPDEGCMAGPMAANEVMVNAIADDSDESSSQDDPMDEEPGETMDDDPDLDLDPEQQRTFGERFISAFGLDGVSLSANGSADDSTMNDKHEFLVNERGYDKENVPPEGSDCLDRMFANEQKLAEMEDGEQDNGGQADGGQTDDDQTDDSQVMEKLEQMEDQMVTVDEVEETVDERLAANQEQTEKEKHTETIIANSDDWSEDDREELLETPTTVLSNMAEDAQASDDTDYRGQGRAGSASAGGADSASEMPSLSANGRLAETESDD